MIDGKKVLALIPARGGSKGIKHKNIIDLRGKPMICYTIEAAKGCSYIDCTVVSTDDVQISEIALKSGAEVPFMRPNFLSEDTSKTIDAVLHAVNFFEERGIYFDILILLQPTSPLRDSDDISRALEHFVQINSHGLVSISEAKTNPILIRQVNECGKMGKLLDISSTCRRQDMRRFYCVNGSIYINRINELTSNTSFNDNEDFYIMDKNHAIDVDEPEDIALVDYYLQSTERE